MLPICLKRRWLRYAAAFALVMGALGCNGSYAPFPTDQVCRDTGYAIASRTFECTGDADLADHRYDAFMASYRCRVTDVERDPVDVDYHCVAQIDRASCDTVASFGDDLTKYLALSPTCRQYLAGPGLEQDAGAE